MVRMAITTIIAAKERRTPSLLAWPTSMNTTDAQVMP